MLSNRHFPFSLQASQPEDGTYDASIKLSKQAITEIKLFLDTEDQWRTGALDNALSQILVDLRPQNYEAWIWHFEDTFGVELDTVLKVTPSICQNVFALSSENLDFAVHT